MKTVVMTVMALMVATVAVAENEPKWTEELKFSCPVSGTDKDGFDALVENTKTNEWECTVTVGTNSPKGSYTYSKRPVQGRSGMQNMGGEAGLTKNLQCQVTSVDCKLTKKGN